MHQRSFGFYRVYVFDSPIPATRATVHTYGWALDLQKRSWASVAKNRLAFQRKKNRRIEDTH